MAHLCVCKVFNDCQARQAIEEHKPKHAEEVHQLIANDHPQCGICLPEIQAMIDKGNATGCVPALKDVSREEVATAHMNLAVRFSKDAGNEPYKENYRRIPLKTIERYFAKINGENATLSP